MRIHPLTYVIICCLVFWALVLRTTCACTENKTAPVTYEYTPPHYDTILAPAEDSRIPVTKKDPAAVSNRLGFATDIEAICQQGDVLHCWYNSGDYHKERLDSVSDYDIHCLDGREGGPVIHLLTYYTPSGDYQIAKRGDIVMMSTPFLARQPAYIFAYSDLDQTPDTSGVLSVPMLGYIPLFPTK